MLVGFFFFVACSTPRIERIDTQDGQLSTLRWGAEDLEELSKKMVSKILLSSKIDTSLYYTFAHIRNDTHDHIDVKMLANKMLVALQQSKRIKLSKEKSDLQFVGKLSSIFKKRAGSKDMFFNFNLSLIDKRGATVIWSEDIEIRKIYKKALFGW